MALILLLAGCGGGGGVASAPTPTPAPTPNMSLGITPTPGVNYDTAEYRRSIALAQHGAITAYQAGASGAGVTVGVIDSGVSDPTGELTGRISAASRDFAGNGTILDSGGHGTEVTMALAASRNGAATMGVAWGATILALRTDEPGSCNSDCSHSTSSMAHALNHAVANGARVVNISLGGTAATPELAQAVNLATAAGTIIVIAGGNKSLTEPDPLARSLADPAISRGLVIIAEALTETNARASFANGALGYESVTLGALGVNVVTIDKNGAAIIKSGSSYSAPEISGAVALLVQAFPNLTSAQIVRLLLDSARDLGVAGPDAEHGVGALDIAKAFAPLGSLSLAGNATPVALTATGALSAAMGDAAGASQNLPTVVTDSLGRAYAADLGGGLRTAVPGPRLSPALDTRLRSLSGSLAGADAHIAMSVAPGPVGGADSNILLLGMEQARTARLIAARMATRIAPGAELALGFASGGEMLRGMTGRVVDPPFLVARSTDLLTADFRAERSMRLRWQVAPGLHAVATGEMGEVGHDDRVSTLSRESQWRRDGRYQATGIGLDAARGPVELSLTATHIRESGTALGARFAPILGAQSARTLLLDLRLRLDAGHGWSLDGNWRRGRTAAAAGGALREGGRFTSQAWSVGAARQGVFERADSLSLRLFRPLRLTGSDFRLFLPSGYDYETGLAVEGVQSLDLKPRGREQSLEAAYATPLGEGWLTANLFHRTQSGNIAAMPPETGGAFRYSFAF